MAHRWSWTSAGPALAVFGALVASNCSPDPTVLSVRSLEGAGRAAFMCLAGPGSSGALRPLSDCFDARPSGTDGVTVETDDFGDGSTPHLYALVTLETRGEVALIDTTAEASSVLDQDPSTPGENALPVGAQPVDIVATPKGTAAFVASAEVGNPALYALPTELIRPCEVDGDRCDAPPPTLSSWPACRLPAAPGAMVMIADPIVNGEVRESCAGAYAPPGATAPELGMIDGEGLGRQKLVVTLPKLGRIVVVDAQTLLAGEPGMLGDCVIEYEVGLSAAVPALTPPPAIPDGPACAVPETLDLEPSGQGISTPAGLAFGADRLYVGDLTTPLIHVLDAQSPCDLVETAPLVGTSLEDPTRAVITSRIAVSPTPTPSLKRYLYAIDVEDRSLMVFDVSEVGGQTAPLVRPGAELNPFQAGDRIRFSSAPSDVVIVHRDEPKTGTTSVAPFGTVCDPREEAQLCGGDNTSCDLGTLYRTSSDYEDGAGPFTLRGAFAMVSLSSGQIAVIDIEDFDAPCRGPREKSTSLGCATDGGNPLDKTTDEPSCNIVLPHAPRSGAFLLTNDDVGRHQPGIQTFPILSLEDGTVVTDSAVMRATIPATGTGVALCVAVGGQVLCADPSTGAIVDDLGPRNTLRMNLEDPRVHTIEQEWSVTYQGALPSFAGKSGDLRLDALGRSFEDPSARFCGGGVQSEAAAREMLAADGVTGAELEAQAEQLADRLFIADELPDPESSHWTDASCTWEACRAAFGDTGVPTLARDIVVTEAYEDHLELGQPQGTTRELVECCFPTLVNYEIRAGAEWVIVGGSSGYLHHMIEDPATGVCRPSCDPAITRKRGRVRSTVTDATATVPDGAPTALESAHFRFAILVPPDAGTEGGPPLLRDMAFRFTTQGAFGPLRGELADADRAAVQPRAIGYLAMIDELFITDGGLEGLLLVTSDLAGNVRQYF